MSELIHLIKHVIGFCGEYSHPSLLLTSGVLLTSMGLYWTRVINYLKDLF